jgi:hypothetical protein
VPAAREDRAARAERQQRDRDRARIEKDIEAREARVAVLEASLADPQLYHDPARSQELVTEYRKLRAELDSLWERRVELG